MRVLIADFDLFRTVGGGQTFYRAIIEQNPQIDFSYLIVNESQSALRPANARPIRYQQTYLDRHWTHYYDVLPPRWCLPAFLKASNIARSISGQRFDVVDLPDYEPFGYFLPAALAHHGVGAERVALSMHGVISTTIGLNWSSVGEQRIALELQEESQYRCVDIRYGLSLSYLDEWRCRSPLPSLYLSPLRFLKPPRPLPTRLGGAPDLNFVGRTERRKGPDLFADLVWWLPSEAYGRARIIGPPSVDTRGVSSDEHLKRFLANRRGAKPVEMVPAATPEELARLFAGRGLTVLPSRYDTFNLVALESLFAGCPTAIGNGAGVCRFLDETFPQVPYIKIDMQSPFTALGEISDVLCDYDRYRSGLIAALQSASPRIEGPSLSEIYSSPAAFDREARLETSDWYDRLIKYDGHSRGGRRAAHEARRLFVRCREVARQKLSATTPVRRRAERKRIRSQPQSFTARYHAIAWMPEQSAGDLERKQLACGQLIADLRIDRTRLWREMARIETLRGNDLVAATYRLRAMRLAGEDRYHDLARVVQTLTTHGYPHEAEVADAMYGRHPDAIDRCRRLLDGRLSGQRRLPAFNYETLDDRRAPRAFRASVIVSLYNAADKLARFLDALSLQTLFASDQAELVLVDSGSPGEEYAVFRRWAEGRRLPMVYARSARRETIQAAWNRGISLARGRYLSFLGVDETILPTALEILAAELDASPDIDWVQANSLITNVDAHGQWTGDVMTYDRTGYAQRLVALETCYLSYVGAMYRRDLHQRLGYYDTSFGAAGDTEFKNRVLPFIKSKAVPQTLGVFWNYPDGQTTKSPRAELEDLRAWYLHRTAAGIGYLLQNADIDEAERLLFDALQYRKSYCRHPSSDIEYASLVAAHLEKHWRQTRATRLREGIERLLRAYRQLDCLTEIRAPAIAGRLERVRQIAELVSNEHRLAMPGFSPDYDVFHDNRYEQHNGIWPTEHREKGIQTPRGRRAA